MAKNKAKQGKSVRNGNSPSPYTKQKKRPYVYSAAYYAWKRAVMTGRVVTNEPVKVKYQSEEYRKAA